MHTDPFRDQLFGSIVKRLRAARVARSYTQADVARELGLNRASIANFETERQRLPVDMLYRYAHYVGLGIDDLFPTWDEVVAGVEVDRIKKEDSEFVAMAKSQL